MSVILGDGQLAQMLLEAAQARGQKPAPGIWSRHHDLQSPAAQVALGPIDADLSEALSRSQLVLFENEFVDVPELRAIAARLPKPLRFVPPLDAIQILQDKLGQKRALAAAQIPHAPYLEARGLAAEPFLAQARQQFGDEFILKWAQLGYDGKGVFFYAREREEAARQFIARAAQAGVAVFAEAKVAFKRELAITAARSESGAFALYPLVETHQRDGICHTVWGPLPTPPEVATWLSRLGEQLKLTGVYTFELFETGEGILVNEIAPRVHNSAHYTQDAAEISQFAMHWRAALNESLPSPHCAPFFGMLNLLGPPGVDLARAPSTLVSSWGPSLRERGFALHWYGKAGVRPGRKLGHINFSAVDRADALRKRQTLGALENEFRARLGSG